MSSQSYLSPDGRPTAVVRHNGSVHRRPGPETPTVLSLLRHLEAAGFPASPRVVGNGYDEDGNQVLTFIEGELVHPRAWSEEGIGRVGQLLRDLHDASARSAAPSGKGRRAPSASTVPGCAGEVARVLAPGGRVCLAILHPVNSGHAIDRTNRDHWVIEAGAYWDDRHTTDTEERDGLRITFHSIHRPLERYFAALEAAGLLTETVREPRGPSTVTTSSSFPFFLHLRAWKPR